MSEALNISVQGGGGITSAALGSALSNVVNGEVVVQIPVFVSGMVGHIYVSPDELDKFQNSAVIQEMLHWADAHEGMADLRNDERKRHE